MRALRIPLHRFAIATALAISCAAALSPSAHADPGRGRGWDRHHDHGHGRPHFAPRPQYNRGAGYHGPRYYAPPRAHAHSSIAPLIGAGILFGTAVALASPPVVVVPAPPPVVVVPPSYYGVRELGPAW